MEPNRAGPVAAPDRCADEAPSAELERLRVARQRQSRVIATLSEAVSNFHRGLSAMRAENAELRVETDDLRAQVRMLTRDGSRAGDELVEVAVEAGPGAPKVARELIVGMLGERLAEPVLADAQLVLSELVTNSVRHSGTPAGEDLTIRLRVWDGRCRLEVEDPGHDGMIAPRTPDPVKGCGMGLNLVQTLSERWGLVRAAEGPTRVWAQVSCHDTPAGPPKLTLV